MTIEKQMREAVKEKCDPNIDLPGHGYQRVVAVCADVADDLLRRFIRFTQLAEGSDHIYVDDRAYVEPDVVFTDEEWAVLERFSQEGWGRG